MSSGYKIKGHQRSRSAKPYDRKTGLVNRVREWLTPSSWLSSWSKGSNDVAVPAQVSHLDRRLSPPLEAETTVSPALSASLFVPRPGPLTNPFLSNPMALLGSSRNETGPSRTMGDVSSHSPGTNTAGGGSTSSSSSLNKVCADANVETRLRSLVSLPMSLRSSGGVPSRPLMMGRSQEDMDSSNNSESSWVAEDSCCAKDDVGQQRERGQRLEEPQAKFFPTSLDLSSTERNVEYMYELGEGSAGVVQPVSMLSPITTEAEQVILHVENPAAKSPPTTAKTPPTGKTPSTAVTTSSVASSRTMLSSSILNRLYTTNPFAMSTPQLSPVHETREEPINQDTEVARSPASHSVAGGLRFHSHSSSLTSPVVHSSLPLPAISTPSKFHTEQSLSRSPFRSPFYSGRTAFGGAASGQKPRLKRPRTESSPPVLAPIRLSVKARPISSVSKGQQMVASQTARKIMETLGNLSSPLANARKLPMRSLPGETQLAKRRRVSLDDQATAGSSILSPPPIAPLRTPSQPSHSNTETQIVPSEKSVMSRQHQTSLVSSRVNDDSETTESIAPPKDASFKTVLYTNDMCASPYAPPSYPLEKDKELRRGGGKMRSARHRKRGAPTDEEEEEKEGCINPIAQPPAVRLNLGEGCSLPKFNFHTQLAPSSKSQDKTPASQSSSMSSSSVQLTTAAAPSLNFSFSAPKSVSSEPIPPKVPELSLKTTTVATFDFSAPTDQRHSPMPLPPPNSSLLQLPSQSSKSSLLATTFKPSPAPITFPKMSTSTAPVVKTMSVEEALKLPEFQLPLSKTGGKASTSKSNRQDEVTCIDLTDSDDEKESTSTIGQSVGAAKISLGSSGLQLGNGGGLKLGTAGGLQLESNVVMSTICGAVTVSGAPLGTSTNLLKTDYKSSTPTLPPLSQFAPPSSSWECVQCLVNNKPKDQKCVACGAARPAAKTDLKSSGPSFKPLSQFSSPSGSWESSQCLVSNQAKDEKCVASTASKPSAKVSTCAMPDFKPLPQFAAPLDSWECGQCLVRNQAKDEKCAACSAPKPMKTDSTTSSGLKPPPSQSVPHPLAALKSNETAKPTILGGQPPPTGSWSCDVCLVQNQASDAKCIVCAASKPHSKTSTDAPPISVTSATDRGKWTCSTSLVVNKAEDTKCVEFSNSKVATEPVSAAPANFLSGLAPPQGSWTCDTCLVPNKAEDTKCVACTTTKPGEKNSSVSGETKPVTSSGATVAGGLAFGASGGLKLGGGLLLAGLASQKGLEPIGNAGKDTQDSTAAAGGGGIKIDVSLSALAQNKGDKSASETKPGNSAPIFGVPQDGSTKQAIPQLPERNPLAGIKFGVTTPSAATTAAAVSQVPLTEIKFGVPSTATSSNLLPTTATSSLQFGFGSSSTVSSSSFKLGSAAVVQTTAAVGQSGGLKLGRGASSSSVDLQLSGAQPAAAPKLVVGGLGQSSMSQSPSLSSGLLSSGGVLTAVSTAVANPLAGLKFGVPPASGALSTSTNTPQLSSQLQFGTMASSSASSSASSVLPFNFMATSTATSASGVSQTSSLGISPFVFSGAKSSSSTGSSNTQPVLQFGGISVPTTSQQQPVVNSMLNASGTGDKSASSLFVFSGNKDVSKINASSPFPSAGSSSINTSGGGFGTSGGTGGAFSAGGGVQPLKLNFGAAQPSGNEPFQFGKGNGNGSGGSSVGTLFGKQDTAATGQPQGLSLIGQQPAPSLTLPQVQSSLFGGLSQQPQSQPQLLGFGNLAQPPSFNFSGQSSSITTGLGGNSGLGNASNLGFPSNTGGLSFGAPSSQGVGLGGVSSQAAASSETKQQGFQFNPNAGVNFNFGGGQSAPMTGEVLFTAGSSQSSAPSSRVIKKARRRVK